MNIEHLKLNKGSYFGERIDIDDVLSSCLKNAKKHGWKVEKIAINKGFEIIVLKHIVSGAAKNVYISSGIHGDEPAGPVSINKLLEKNQWPSDVNIYLLPCLNPTGCKLHTRENEDGVDLNRDYLNPTSKEVKAHTNWLEKQVDFDMSICVHEDWEAEGFYIYGSNKIIARKIIKEVEKVFPIEQNSADERLVKKGVVSASYKHKLPFWPEAFYLHIKKKSMNFTLETSSDYMLEDRVKAHMKAIETALGLL